MGPWKPWEGEIEGEERRREVERDFNWLQFVGGNEGRKLVAERDPAGNAEKEKDQVGTSVLLSYCDNRYCAKLLIVIVYIL